MGVASAVPPPSQSRESIGDLVLRYALLVRRKARPDWRELLSEDVVFEVRVLGVASGGTERRLRSRDVGREAVGRKIEASLAGGTWVCPQISNLLIAVHGATATSNCLMTSRLWPGDALMAGEYDDTYRFEDGRWLFTSRIFTMFEAGGDASSDAGGGPDAP